MTSEKGHGSVSTGVLTDASPFTVKPVSDRVAQYETPERIPGRKVADMSQIIGFKAFTANRHLRYNQWLLGNEFYAFLFTQEGKFAVRHLRQQLVRQKSPGSNIGTLIKY